MTSIINHFLSLLLLLLLPLPHFLSSSNPFNPDAIAFQQSRKKPVMDDTNMLAADCIVISCCCQCMILQILIFLLLKLPNKLFKKTKEYAKKFRAARKKRAKIVQVEMERHIGDSSRSLGKSFRINLQDLCLVESNDGLGICCMDETERALEEFSGRGAFAFGSFWGTDACSSRSFRWCCKEDGVVDYEEVRHRLMELFGDVKFSYR